LKISILVLSYGIEPTESETLRSILKHCKKTNNTQLVVWNNGPEKIKSYEKVKLDLEKKFDNVELRQTIENRALSEIYNLFIKDYCADRYIILDHDSTLNERYLNDALSENEIGVGVPIITSEGKTQSPSFKVRKGFESGPYTSKDRIVGIGSGVVISHNTAIKLCKHYGNVFDTRFLLYGVDTSFFFRVRGLGLNSHIKLLEGFEHNLSRLEKESDSKTHFRKLERSYAIGLCTRFYFSHCRFEFLKIIIRKLRLKDTLYIRTIVKTLFSGKHPRHTS